MKKPQEVEVKIAVASASWVRKKLRDAGFHLRAARVFERNIVLDDDRGRLRQDGLLLRVRSAGSSVLCTFKGPAAGGRHKRREEREFDAGNLDECLAVFEGLGYRPSFRYDKYRTEFTRGSEAGHVTLDETPIGIFMELEGAARWIDATARSLGFSRADYITASYGKLYLVWCCEHGKKPGNMVFRGRNAQKGTT